MKQATFSDIQKNCKDVEFELKNYDRQINGLLCEIDQIKRHNSSVESQLHEINCENMKLQFHIQEQEERQQSILAGHNAYRKKMEDHKMAVAEAKSRMPMNRELMEARELVRQLRGEGERDALEADLHNAGAEAAKQAHQELRGLEQSVLVKMKTVEEKQAFLRREREVHAQLRKDIEIQNKRFDAIVKRLRCQLSKAQFDHRDLISDIKHMERKVEELTRQVEQS
ncbi:hypothetical protein ACEWY4_016999 [Coilia grayii]|uniref:Coiled-coil domain-containing protein 122 n=1 Tax=Coilia grayii TaxID=363190 RepID=A0ABD1JN71_9TELE